MSTTIVQPTVLNNTKPPLSAVSWGAILAGAVSAAAISLILFILGIGLGLTSVSPWSGEGISAEALGITTIAWITFTSLAASALGGYISGRLRTRWASTHGDEVYFRDTAHGFLAWGVATLLTATLLTSVSAKLAATTADVAANVVGGTAGVAVAGGGIGAGIIGQGTDTPGDAGGEANATMSYFLDSLFRRGPSASGTFNTRTVNQPQVAPPQQAEGSPAANEAQPVDQTDAQTVMDIGVRRDNQASDAPALAEMTRIMVRGVQKEGLTAADRDYAAQMVAEYTGMSRTDAAARVDQVFSSIQTELREAETRARELADEARAASAKLSLWFFISLLAGAFVASFVAVFGGKQRDNTD